MERLNRSLYCLAGIFLVAGTFAHIGTPDSAATVDETWMESHSLSALGKFHMVPGDPADPSVTYKMDKDTYEALAPSSIVCRQFTDGSNTFDVVLVASRSKDSFHDPRICFGSQAWNLDQESEESIQTSRGPVPLTVVDINSTDAKRWAAFSYRDPNGFVGNTNRLKWDLFSYSLLHAKAGEGVFYRFIGLSPQIDRKALVEFVRDYMNASARSSKGYF